MMREGVSRGYLPSGGMKAIFFGKNTSPTRITKAQLTIMLAQAFEGGQATERHRILSELPLNPNPTSFADWWGEV